MIVKYLCSNCMICRQQINVFINKPIPTPTLSPVTLLARRYYSKTNEKVYSESDQAKILEIVNNCKLETLQRFKITKNRVNNIIQHREKKGNFEDLSQLKNLEGFTGRITQKFFDSILSLDTVDNEKTSVKPLKMKGQLLHPQLTDPVREKVKSVMSLHVMLNSISYTCINKDRYELTEWGSHSLPWPEDNKVNMSHIMEIAWHAVSCLPPACISVTEAPPSSLRASGGDASNPRALNINLQRVQLVASVVALLTARCRLKSSHRVFSSKDESFEPAVYFLKPSVASRLFETYIGKERVSCEDTIRSMFKAKNSLSIPSDLQSYYESLHDRERELVGQSLLVNRAFIELCLRKS